MDHTHKNRSYTIVFKLDIIAYAEETSNCRALKENKDINIDQTRVLSSCGRKAMYPGLEKELVDYIKKKREEKLAVTTSMIRKKAKELGKTLDIRDAKFSRSWCDRFRKQHSLVKRTRTQIVQKFPKNMLLVIRDFLDVLREKTNVIEKQFIISFDETPMWFDMPWNSTIDFQGVCEVPIKTTGSDKLRFIVVLGYWTAPHANMKGDLMISTYIPQAIRSRPNGFFKSKSIIFVDGHRSHVRDDVKKAFKAERLDLLEIPGETTSVLQPPDVLVNKPFKNEVRQRWEHWIDEGKKVLTKNKNRKKASYELVCEWVSKTWKEISPNILVRSFEVAGLTLNPDGSENDKMSQRLQTIVQAVAENQTNELNMNELLDALPEDENESVIDVENQTDNEENTTDETDDENAIDYEYVTDDDERMIE
ncbi:4234_t:CDS:2 [Dentiscutata erythropus]|uniref:4234_t:CDS:1 n=1 Tax=Dentiscutata erythropus TaxID=1348616 RepID=A0A9N9AS44_9GLOM|nr:4234_t:CDS:2 [Dentiscutata erythropus]